jgi:ribonucleoside-diphosphate reductase alpha chain
MANRKEVIEWYDGDEMAADVLINKYLKDDEAGPKDMWERLARELSAVESDDSNERFKWYEKFYDILEDWKFIPGGRINYAIGRDENVSCTNCYVIPIRDTYDYEVWHKESGNIDAMENFKIPADSLEGIYNWLKESALTYRSTGGVGVDITCLRPKGMPVKNSGGESPGACSFMDLFSRSTHTVHQKLRRGALMITINVHHPDVLEFINIKKILGKIKFEEGNNDGYNDLYKLVEHANISVLITDEFLDALDSGEEYEQRWPVDENPILVQKKTSAKKVWEAIISNAHAHAEPGILFIDNHRKNDALAYVNPVITTNPCGEQFLGAYGNCLLGHMNLSKYVIDKMFDHSKFSADIAVAVRFLDNCITWNDGKHALAKQNETALNERRIGLGVTGLGDMLIRMGIKYDSDAALNIIEGVMQTFRNAAYAESIVLAKDKGAFPWLNSEKWKESEFVQRWLKEQPDNIEDAFNAYGIRNSFLLTVAPVGSGSIIGQVSSGIEPIFATSYTRRVRKQDGHQFEEYKTYPKIIEELFKDDSDLPDYVTTAYDVNPDYRVKLQAIIQKYVDNSISSTINLPKDTTVETVGKIYQDAWKLGLKSTTVYRQGSREGVLITDDEKKKIEKPKPQKKLKRPIELAAKVYKIPADGERKLYITIGSHPEDPKRPFEVFISTYGKDDSELKAISVLLSSILRKEEKIEYLIEILKKIESPKPPAWWHDADAKRRHVITSVPQAVAIALEKFIKETKPVEGNGASKKDMMEHAEQCPKCSDLSYVQEEGCGKCLSCGYGKCS